MLRQHQTTRIHQHSDPHSKEIPSRVFRAGWIRMTCLWQSIFGTTSRNLCSEASQLGHLWVYHHRPHGRSIVLGPKDDIPDERYAKIARLWPMKRQAPRRLIQTIWRDVALYPEDNIFSQPVEAAIEESPASRSSPARLGESRWGMDDARRARLIADCTSSSTSFQKGKFR